MTAGTNKRSNTIHTDTYFSGTDVTLQDGRQVWKNQKFKNAFLTNVTFLFDKCQLSLKSRNALLSINSESNYNRRFTHPFTQLIIQKHEQLDFFIKVSPKHTKTSN